MSKNHDLSNLITLCVGCHRGHHQIHLLFVNGEYVVHGDVFKNMSIKSVKVA